MSDDIDYTQMTSNGVIAYCGQDASRWAKAFCQHALKYQGVTLNEGWVIGWFANAIMGALDTKARYDEKKLQPSEVIFGFLGWVTSRRQPITLSAHHNASIAAKLASTFCDANQLDPPRPHWNKYLVHPPEVKDE